MRYSGREGSESCKEKFRKGSDRAGMGWSLEGGVGWKELGWEGWKGEWKNLGWDGWREYK